jgi:uncharacterized protein (TIGR03435 family)
MLRCQSRPTRAGLLCLIRDSCDVVTTIFSFTAFAVVAVLLAGRSLSFAQAQAATATSLPPMSSNADPVFEVATIKPSDTSSPHGTLLTSRGGHSIAYNFPLIELISFAYGVHVRQIVGGPASLLQTHFDIEGLPNIGGHPNHDQSKLMYRKLLATRFGLVFHRESRELPAYAIVVAKGAPKLAKTKRDPGESTTFLYTNQIVLTVRNASMSDFAHGMQETFMDKPVVDQTGLTDRFDFELKWTPDEFQSGVQPPAPSSENVDAPPGLYTAIQEQLGLKIVSTKAPVEALVIDHITSASAN